MQIDMKTVTVNGLEYVEKSALQIPKIPGKEVIIRTYSAGVHVGILENPWDNVNAPVLLKNARRIFRWYGANTLNEIANNGVDRSKSKISEPVPEISLSPIEVIPVAEGVDLTKVWDND